CLLFHILPFSRFKYFISQPGIIHWINVQAAPFGKSLAVRPSPVFLPERRPFMSGATVLAAWLVLRARFLPRERLCLGAAAAGKPGKKRSCPARAGLSRDPVAGNCCRWSRARAEGARELLTSFCSRAG
uniref:Uncharacterized protein n=1 Tax=Apteryx owenii TaxID=8824 RepID=A0A8B9PVU6_APTOW